MTVEAHAFVHQRRYLHQLLQREIRELKVRIICIDESDYVALLDLPPNGTFVCLRIAIERDDAETPQRQVFLQCVLQLPYRLLLQAVIEAERVFCRPELYAGYYAHMCLAGLALARVDLILDGEAAGIRTLQEVQEQALGAHALLRNSIREFGRHAAPMVRMTDQAREALKSTLNSLREGRNHVASYRTELEFCAANGIKFEEWERIGSEIKEPGVIALVPAA